MMEYLVIISRNRRYIFLKTNKVGGTSLEIALSKYCGPDDVITPITKEDERARRRLRFRGPQNYRKSISEWTSDDFIGILRSRRIPVWFYNHIPAKDVKRLIPSEEWESFYKFSIVRNPFDWAVSKYLWDKRRGRAGVDFRKWLLKAEMAFENNRNTYCIDGDIAVDRLIDYDRMDSELADLSRTLELPEDLYETMASIRAKDYGSRKKSPTSEWFAGFDEGIHFIENVAKTEIEMFNYTLKT